MAKIKERKTSNKKGDSTRAKTSTKAKSANRALDREIESNIMDIVRLEEEQRSHRTFGERLSEVIAAFCGSMTFVYVHVVWFGLWITANVATERFAFDPFPFTFLTLVVSLEAIFLSTFILISQNHDTQLSERRNHLDLQINMLSEQENTKTLELLQAIAEKVGVSCTDESMTALLEKADPKTMVEQILEASNENTEDVGSNDSNEKTAHK
ncbi:MAG TPA: DUF1003 domain-containing protein [Pyrinomonadaceae bacterium]|jgi:uncharacterized membrane protein|nr:DUF1003 domain-containing protein [Pyrinomonadaceae bacterium]